MSVLVGAVAAPLLWNAAFTLGATVQSLARNGGEEFARRLGPLLFIIGLVFSFLLIASPAIIWAALWFNEAIHGFPHAKLQIRP